MTVYGFYWLLKLSNIHTKEQLFSLKKTVLREDFSRIEKKITNKF